jgi:hypothetical protein
MVDRKTMNRAYDRKRGDSWEYNPGDKVYLEGTNITMDRPIKKLDKKRHNVTPRNGFKLSHGLSYRFRKV